MTEDKLPTRDDLVSMLLISRNAMNEALAKMTVHNLDRSAKELAQRIEQLNEFIESIKKVTVVPLEPNKEMTEAGAWVMKDIQEVSPYTHPNDRAALMFKAMSSAWNERQ
jgi:Asp-tRNA(Asn)/Glu-tRNA(Gln) amidotransferase C subunit